MSKSRSGGLLDFFKQAKNTVGELQQQLQHLAGEIEARQREREDLQSLPLTREDATARLHRWIDEQAERYPNDVLRHQRALIHDNPQQQKAHDVIAVLIKPLGGQLNSSAVAWLFGEQLKDRIAAGLAEMEWPDDIGPPLAERRQRLTDLDKEIPELEAELAELVREAEAAGINVARVKPPRRDHAELYKGGKPLAK